MLLALLIFSNIILNLTESHFIWIIHIKSYDLDCIEDHLKLVALPTWIKCFCERYFMYLKQVNGFYLFS